MRRYRFRLHLLLRKKLRRPDIGRGTIVNRIVEPLNARGDGDVTQLLVMARDGDREAMNRLLPLVYAELRRVAERQLRGERQEHTLGASGLIHEAYLKLVDQMQVDWQSREHFFAISARAMRQVLIDYARRKNADKRGGDRQRTSLDGKDVSPEQRLDELLALDQALERLRGIDDRLRQIVEFRFFCGLTEQETADLLGVTPRTVQRDWVKARAWLYKELYPKRD